MLPYMAYVVFRRRLVVPTRTVPGLLLVSLLGGFPLKCTFSCHISAKGVSLEWQWSQTFLVCVCGHLATSPFSFCMLLPFAPTLFVLGSMSDNFIVCCLHICSFELEVLSPSFLIYKYVQIPGGTCAVWSPNQQFHHLCTGSLHSALTDIVVIVVQQENNKHTFILL